MPTSCEGNSIECPKNGNRRQVLVCLLFLEQPRIESIIMAAVVLGMKSLLFPSEVTFVQRWPIFFSLRLLRARESENIRSLANNKIQVGGKITATS